MKGTLIKKFAAVCALGGALCLIPSMVSHDEPAFPPAPAPATEPAPEIEPPAPVLPIFCAEPNEIRRDEQDRPWVRVESLTRDGVPLSFDLNLSFRHGGADETTTITDCDGISRHILGLAKIIYAEQILTQDYTALPAAAATLPRLFAAEMNKRLVGLLGASAPEITGMGINNVTAPGMSRALATAMMTQGLNLPSYQAPRLLGLSHDNHTIEFGIAFNYAASPEAYLHFGPHKDAIKARITGTLHEKLAAAAVQWDAACMESGRVYIESEAYSAAAQELAATVPGLYLLALELSTLSFPADVSLPPAPVRTEKALCYAP